MSGNNNVDELNAYFMRSDVNLNTHCVVIINAGTNSYTNTSNDVYVIQIT